MSAWFESSLVRTDDTEAVRKVLVQLADETGCNFFVGPPIRGWTSFFPGDEHDERSGYARNRQTTPS